MRKPSIIFLMILFCSFFFVNSAFAVLEFCADPDNLPFTSSAKKQRGVYVEVAEKLAQNMNEETEYYWYGMYFVKKAIRDTLFKGTCDIVLGVPFGGGFMGKSLGRTQPFLEVGFAVVLPKEMPFKAVKDFFGKKIGVVYASPPASILARILSVEVLTYDTPEEVMAELAAQKLEMAFIWGPSAGYYNKFKLNNAFQVLPVAGKTLNFKVAMGVRARDQQLRLKLSRELSKMKKEIKQFAEHYGFPTGEPLKLNAGGFFNE